MSAATPARPRLVLFACVHNAGRSQIAAALLNQRADPTQVRAISAGTEPGQHLHPVVAEVLREIGVAVDALRPQRLTLELARGADLLITMGCGEACPVVPGLPREDWPLPDPKGQPLDAVRELREEIAARVERLLVTLGCEGSRPR